MTKPFRIEFQPVRAVTATKHDENVLASKHRLRIVQSKPNGKPLAIVGGGPSVLQHLDELRAWPGEIWAINWTCKWLSDRGIASKMLTVDSSIKSIERAPLNTGAVLASCVDPHIFSQYPDAVCFDLIEDAPGGICGGSSTACRIPVLCIKMGYIDVHFFGVEGSFDEGKTHVDRNETEFVNYLRIRAGNEIYTTRDDLYLQCESLSETMRNFPEAFKNRSGGLLQGMIDYPDTWEVVAVSGELKGQLEGDPRNSKGLFEGGYYGPASNAQQEAATC